MPQGHVVSVNTFHHRGLTSADREHIGGQVISVDLATPDGRIVVASQNSFRDRMEWLGLDFGTRVEFTELAGTAVNAHIVPFVPQPPEKEREEPARAEGFSGTVVRVVRNGYIVQLTNGNEVLVPLAAYEGGSDTVGVRDMLEFHASSKDGEPITDSTHVFRRDEYVVDRARKKTGEPTADGIVLILWHDFPHDPLGGQFVATLAADAKKRGKLVVPVEATRDYVTSLENLNVAKGPHRVARLIIATHGTEGELWFGSAKNPRREDAMAAKNGFLPPLKVGQDLAAVLNFGMNIIVAACGQDNPEALQGFCEGACSTVQAASGTVYINLDRVGGKHTIQCDQGSFLLFSPGNHPVKQTRRIFIL